MGKGFTTVGMLAGRGVVRAAGLTRACRAGQVPGAFFDRLTWQWWVPVAGWGGAMAAAFNRVRS